MSVSSASAPLDAPLYGATIGQAFTRFWKKYATFSGRASRSEYWWWFLISVVIGGVLEILAVVLGGGGMGQMDSAGRMTSPNGIGVFFLIVIIAWGLATLIPGLALVVRRLHDANFAGPFIFLGLIPFIGGIIVLILVLLPSNPAGARFDRSGY